MAGHARSLAIRNSFLSSSAIVTGLQWAEYRFFFNVQGNEKPVGKATQLAKIFMRKMCFATEGTHAEDLRRIKKDFEY